MKRFANSTLFSGIAAAACLAALTACGAGLATDVQVVPGELDAHIRFLSDDLLEGRALGSRGIEAAALYQESRFREYGLEPAFSGSYRQTFPLRGCRLDPQASLEVRGAKRAVPLVQGSDFLLKTYRPDAPAAVEAAALYCGFLIQAPERKWDDLKGADVKGKILICEINEPGNVPGGVFDGEDMTYYGRWPYKFEKAAALGAAGCLIIHNAKGAAYGWDTLRNGWMRESFFLPDVPQVLLFQGWLSGEAADRMFTAAGFNRAALAAAAEKPAFTPVPLKINIRARQRPSFRTVSVSNVAAVRHARPAGGEERFVVVSAHYDHLGQNESLPGHKIFNGAVDNCSASATMLALARYYAREKNPRVGIIFAAVTAEEELMLGSEYFARHLPVPASRILGDINLEMTNVWGETEDVYAIGGSHSDLDEIAAQAASRMGLRYIPERNRELGYFFRSDQISFARHGIPAVWLHEGVVSKTKGPDYMPAKAADYVNNKYHKPADQIEKDWDLAGAVQIARWAEGIIAILAERPGLPQFKPTSSFKR